MEPFIICFIINLDTIYFLINANNNVFCANNFMKIITKEENSKMKVIGIIGSPRKGGSTEILIERILSGEKPSGVEVKMFFLNVMNIHPCQGCNFFKNMTAAVKKMI